MRAEAQRPRILIVEDDELVLELIITRLEISGFQTFYARDGVEGLTRLKDVAPQGLILDINMPLLDGFGVLQRMRATGAHTRTKTMVLTARNQPDDVRKAILLGAQDFLAKPFTDEQLIARAKRLVRSAPHRTAPPTATSRPPVPQPPSNAQPPLHEVAIDEEDNSLML